MCFHFGYMYNKLNIIHCKHLLFIHYDGCSEKSILIVNNNTLAYETNFNSQFGMSQFVFNLYLIVSYKLNTHFGYLSHTFNMEVMVIQFTNKK